MFRSVNIGNPDLNIHKYNGGVFADDPVLDGLKLPDEVFALFRDLAEYDFRPPSVVADAEIVADSRLIDVEILGHIFEQSINDLEKLQTELEKPAEAAALPNRAKDRQRIASNGQVAHNRPRRKALYRQRKGRSMAGTGCHGHRLQCLSFFPCWSRSRLPGRDGRRR